MSSEADIKRAFRKLSLKYHPDKVSPEEKEKVADLFVDISKAHKVYVFYY
jgi:curved DNA-binding protein CbpA